MADLPDKITADVPVPFELHEVDITPYKVPLAVPCDKVPPAEVELQDLAVGS